MVHAISRDARKSFLAVAAIFTLIGIAFGFAMSGTYLNHDSSWYLIATRRFLEGGVLYVDLVEINPPLSFYLTVPALFLSDLMAWPDKVGFFAYVSMVATVGNIWAASIILRSDLPSRQAVGLILALPVLTLLFQINEFGQREHLMMGFCIPYFMRMVLSERFAPSRLEEIALGVSSFFGFALKPYFYFAPAFLALAMIWRTKSLRAAFSITNITLALSTLVYVAFIVIWHGEYLTTIIPIAREVYHSSGLEVSRRWLQPSLLTLPFILFALVGRKDRSAETVYILSIGIGFLISYFVQFKGWNYHVVPASAFLFLASVSIALDSPSRLRESIPLSILLMIAIAASLGQQLLRGTYQPNSNGGTFFKTVEGDEESILVLSSNVSAAFPFVNEAGADWASRYPTQWFIPGAIVSLQKTDCSLQLETCDRLQSILNTARGHVIEDLRKFRPALVYIDERAKKSHFEDIPFDYLDFLSEDPTFVREWKNYQRAGSVADYGVYRRMDLERTNDATTPQATTAPKIPSTA